MLLVAASVFVAGCLPIPVKYRQSPAILGTLRGTPELSPIGVHVYLSVAYQDSTCTQVAAEAVTDEQGAFQFGRIEQRERYILLLPFDRVGTYRICATADDGRIILFSENYMHRPPRHAAMHCAMWRSQGGVEGSCSRSESPSAATGGTWSAENSSGTYRVITFRHEGEDSSASFRTIVQWISRDSAGLSDTIFAMRELREEGYNIRWPEPTLLHCDDVWYASIGRQSERAAGVLRGWPLGIPGEVGPLRQIPSRCESAEQ